MKPAVPQDGGIVRRTEAAHALEAMFSIAAAAGAPMKLLSGYRSYATQAQLYAHYAASSACLVEYCFVETPAAVWTAANAFTFGFIVPYQLGHDSVTAYYAES